MPWRKTVCTNTYAQLGLSTKGHAIKGLVVWRALDHIIMHTNKKDLVHGYTKNKISWCITSSICKSRLILFWNTSIRTPLHSGSHLQALIHASFKLILNLKKTRFHFKKNFYLKKNIKQIMQYNFSTNII